MFGRGAEQLEVEPVPDDGLVPFELVLDVLGAALAASTPPLVRPEVSAVMAAVLGKWSFMVLRPFRLMARRASRVGTPSLCGTGLWVGP
jgi:hypothetical protein